MRIAVEIAKMELEVGESFRPADELRQGFWGASVVTNGERGYRGDSLLL